MAGDEVEKTEKNILYELLVLSEWVQDFENGLPKSNLTVQENPGFFSPWRFFRKPKFDNRRFLQNEYPWHLAVSQDGRVVAVLQESLLEIRTAKDEYSSVKGRASLPLDQCPQLRKLMWSPDNSVLAVARDNGIVTLYNLLGCNIATIQPTENPSNEINPVVGLLFLQPKFKSTKWTNELLIIYHDGKVKSILLAALDGYEPEENIQFSLESYYPQGVTAVAYHASHHILLVAGPCSNSHGITVWRLLNDYPYLKLAIDSVKTSRSSSSLFRFLPGFSTQNNPSTISKMRISPNGDFLACLHFSGDISLWRLPGVWLHKRWPLVEQPQHHMVNPLAYDSVKGEHYFYPVDISWWSNSALAVARRSGAVSVCSVSTLENLLGDSPEFLAGPPRISSVHGEKSGVIALECEITCNYRNRTRIEDSEIMSDSDSEASVLQASIQAALYSFTDIERFEPKRKTPKIIQRTYRLVALKRTTPEELYSRKIDNEDYEEALALAYTYNLDRDLVYQRQWRTSNVSVQSIYDYLDKVRKILWVANECVERVPDTADAARELLEFGLKKTQLGEDVRYEDLDSENRRLLNYRRQIFLFLDNLTVYEKIISSPDKYNSSEYDDFRRKHPIVATVNFARQENWQAVSIMFTFRGKETLPHWLPIISNFPETLMPLQYRSLLPELIGDEVVPWEVKKIRFSDWSENEPFFENSESEEVSNDCIYKYDPSLREFQTSELTGSLVEQWYRRRTYEIEENTGLVDHALNFVKLARERNVKNLDQLYFDLLTLESLVYQVQDDTITLSKLETMSHLDQAKLLLSRTDCRRFVKDLKNLIVPFANRCEKKGCDTLYSLLRGVLLEFSDRGLDFTLALLKHLKENELSPLKLNVIQRISLALDCLYSCPRINELENCFSILECLPAREDSTDIEEMKLHDKIDKLEFHLEVCEISHRYSCPKSVRYVYESEDNEEVAKQLMKEMAEYTKNESLDFTELLSDLKYLQSKVFTCVDINYCYELFALTQMSCECEEIIQSAEEILACRKNEPGKLIPFNKSLELVLEAARAHFEKAVSFDDACIKLSQTCLRLINEPHPEVNEELDLIESVQLLGDFDVKLLPLQVRKCTDRSKLIESCLKSKPGAYKFSQRLLQLAHTLRICGDDRMKREGQVLTLIAEYALQNGDYNVCSEICNRLITRNYSPAWTMVSSLAQKDDFENTSVKKFLLAFAIMHCPIECIEELIETRIKLTAPIFQKTKREDIYVPNHEKNSLR